MHLTYSLAMHLHDLPKAMRPREKLLTLGSQALTDVELLSVLLGSGRRGQSVLQLAQSLLDSFQGLAGLLYASPEHLRSSKGLGGSARRSQLLAVVELSRRALLQKMRARDIMTDPDNVKQFLQLQLGQQPREVFGVLFLDGQNRLLRFEEMFIGTLNQTSVYPREVVKLALSLGACAVILSHNHPSGEVRPSQADEKLTQALRTALALVDIRVLDHVIVGPGRSWSMAENSAW
jgi:DNA repair protein RadC